MKALLARLAVRKALGLYITDNELTLVRMALTPLGPVEVDRSRESYGPDQLGEALERMLKPYMGRRKSFHVPIAVGIPTRQVFFSTRPKQTQDREMTPEVLLHEVLQSANINVDDMAVDLIEAQPDKRPVVSIVSCRRKYMSALLSTLEERKVTPYRVEPAPCALLRLASSKYRAPRKAKSVVRVFLGPSEALAVQIAGEIPLIWRGCPLPSDPEGAISAVASTVLSLQILAKYCGTETDAEVVMIHGRPDLGEILASPKLKEKLNIRIVHHPGPDLVPENIATGLAMSCQPTVYAFDLAKTLKPRPTIWEIFPWGEVAIQVAVLMLATLFLNHTASGLETKYRRVKSDIGKHKWMAKLTEANLDGEKKDLTAKFEVMQKVLDTKTLWTRYTEEVAEHLSPNITIKSFDGLSEMEPIGQKSMVAAKPKKSFVLKMSTGLPPGQVMPKEIDDLLEMLRTDEKIHRDFPIIEVADLKRTQKGTTGAKAIVDFSVICLPKPAEVAPKAAPKKKEEH